MSAMTRNERFLGCVILCNSAHFSPEMWIPSLGQHGISQGETSRSLSVLQNRQSFGSLLGMGLNYLFLNCWGFFPINFFLTTYTSLALLLSVLPGVLWNRELFKAEGTQHFEKMCQNTTFLDKPGFSIMPRLLPS